MQGEVADKRLSARKSALQRATAGQRIVVQVDSAYVVKGLSGKDAIVEIKHGETLAPMLKSCFSFWKSHLMNAEANVERRLLRYQRLTLFVSHMVFEFLSSALLVDVN